MVHSGTGPDTLRLLVFLLVDNQLHPFKSRNLHGLTHRKFIATNRIPKLTSQRNLCSVPGFAQYLSSVSYKPFNACGNWPSEVFPHYPSQPKKDEKKWNRNESCLAGRQKKERYKGNKRE